MSHLPRKFVDDRTSVSVKDYGAVGDGITNDFTAIMAAHNALPSEGGTIHLPPGSYSVNAELAFTKPIVLHLDRCSIISDNTTSILISTTSSLTIEGIDPFNSSLIPKAGGTAILIKPRTFTIDGKEVFLLRKLKINGGARGVDGYGLTGFYGGQFSIEDCFFTNQSDVSVWLDSSVFYSHIVRTQFVTVAQAIFVKDNCELKIHHCTIDIPRTSTKAGIEGRGVAHLDIDCCTILMRRPNTSPDILLYPSADNLDGITWIRNTKLSPEGYTDLRTGPHILIYDSAHPNYALYSLDIENNRMYGPGPLFTTNLQRTSGISTVTVQNDWPEGHGLEVGETVIFAFNLTDSSFSGIFTITAVGAITGSGPYFQTISWVQDLPDVVLTSAVGAVHNGGMSAIEFRNPVSHARVVGNELWNYRYGLDDGYQVTSTVLDFNSLHSFEDNKLTSPLATSYFEFKYGGKGFSKVDPRVGSAQPHVGGPPRPNETLGLVNRLTYSEDFTSWVSPGGMLFTSGQSDPWGTDRATLLQRQGIIEVYTGTAITEGMYIFIDDSFGSPRNGFLSFWAKAGSLDFMTVSVFNGTSGNIIFQHNCSMTSDWNRYVIPFVRNQEVGLNFVIIAPGANERIKGTCYLTGVQVSDTDSDYVATSGTVYNDALFGNSTQLGRIAADEVIVRPLNTGGDDAARLQSILAQNVGKRVVLSKGTYSWQTPCEVPSNSWIVGNADVTIISTIAPVDVGDPINVCFYNFIVGVGSATTLSSSVSPGDYSALIVNNNVAVGDTVLLSPVGITNVNQVLKCVAKTGSSPWRIHFDEPIEFAMSSGSQVQSVTRGSGIKIEGNGMIMTGTGSRAVEFGAVENCLVSGIKVTRDQGNFTSIVMSYDVAGRNNTFRDIYIDGYGAQACLALECNIGSVIDNCTVSGATATSSACGFYLPTSKRCRVINSIARNCYEGLSLILSGAGDLEGSQRCSISDCQFIENTQYGLAVHGGKHIQIINCIADRNGGNGFAVFNGLSSAEEIQLDNCISTNSTNDGFLLEGKNIILNNCISNSSGLAGFHIVNDGLGGVSSVILNNGYCTANAGAAVFHDAVGGRVLCSNFITKLNQGAGFRILNAGYLYVNGWDSEDDGLSGLTGTFECSSTGSLTIESARVKNLTSTVLWTGILDGTGTVVLTDYVCEMAGGSGVKAIIDVAAAGTFIGNNVRAVVTSGTLTYGVFAGHSVACKVFLDEHCDLSAAATPLTLDAAAQVGSGYIIDTSRDFEIKFPNKTTNGGTGANITIQAQTETGTTSVGGNLNLFSGGGTSLAGYVKVGAGSNTLLQMSYLSNFAYIQPDPSRAGMLFQNSTGGQAVEFASSIVAFFADSQLYFGDNGNGNHIIDFPVNSLTDATVAFGPLQTAVAITQTQRVSTGANDGVNFTISAQQGQNQTGFVTNNSGGDLIFKSGLPGTGGTGESQPDVSFMQFWPSGAFTVKFKNEGGFAQWKYDGYVVGLSVFMEQMTGIGTNVGSGIFYTAGQGQNRSSGTNNAGGDIVLTTGAAGTGGTGGHPGSITLGLGDGNIIFFATDTLTILNNAGVNAFVASGGTGGNIGIGDGDNTSLIIVSASSQISLGIGNTFNSIAVDTSGVSINGGAGFGSSEKTVSIADAITTPTTNPSGGGILYSEGGALKWRGSSGTTTTIAPA